jgi:3-oxoacyl-[acyl-carrier protein] reductase
MAIGASIAGKVAIVTGGSNGIGAATVRMLAEAGARTVICYNSSEARARALRESLPGDGHRIAPLELTDPASVRALAATVQDAFGRADIVVNSAGMTKPIPHADLEALDEAFFDQVLIANARGPYSVIRAFLPLLRAAAPSVVVNVSSVAAFNGAGSNIAYGASKAALDTLTISLARALGPEVRLLCVSPGPVATDFVAGRGREQIAKIMASAPLRRVIEPEEIAATIMACITHLGAATGTRIVVDGGRSL